MGLFIYPYISKSANSAEKQHILEDYDSNRPFFDGLARVPMNGFR